MRSARLVLVLVLAACAAASGPQPIAWDREPCTHCHMLISERAYAAQALTADGRALSFDDPGCLLAWLGRGGVARELWFHHLREDRWIRGDRVGFVTAGQTPMGFGLGAVDAGAPGAISLAAARARAGGSNAGS